MSDAQKPLTSTVPSGSPETEALLSSESKAASDDGSLQTSEIKNSIVAFLQALESNSKISEKDPTAQLKEASPAVEAFVQKLQQAIAEAKSSSPQGQLLAQQLALNTITAEQFKSQVEGIVLTPSQLEAAVAVDLPVETQKLLLKLTSDTDLKKLNKLISIAAAKGSEGIAPLLSNPIIYVPHPIPHLGSNSNILAPTPSPKVTTSFKDEKLSFLQNLFLVAKRIAEQNLKASAASLLSLRPQPRIMTGARAVLKVNGKVVALCTNVQYEVNTDWAEIRGIDELMATDLAPMVYSVRGSMSIYRVPNKSPIGDFIAQDMFRGIIWPYSTIELRDKRTDELLMLVKRAAITSRSEAFSKNQLTTTNLSFVGIGFRDEMMPELLPDVLVGEDEGTGGLLDAFKDIGSSIKKLIN